MLCDDLDGWDAVGDGREVQEGEDICIHIHFVIQQKLTHLCKAIIPQ